MLKGRSMSVWARYSTPNPLRPPHAHRLPIPYVSVSALPQVRRTATARWPHPGDQTQAANIAAQGPQTALTSPILIVDDDAAIRASISEILELEGYPVITAADGAAALRQIEHALPALMLLDMRMPGLNGWDVASALQQRGIVVPILVMTAAQDARRWAEQIGAGGYLAKPFDLDDLLAAIERLLPS